MGSAMQPAQPSRAGRGKPKAQPEPTPMRADAEATGASAPELGDRGVVWLSQEITDEDGFSFRFAQVPVELIVVDRKYQRNLSVNRARVIARRFKARAMATLVVNIRESDGQFVVIDGQHRLEALRLKGRESALCQVYLNMEYQEEAEDFNIINTNQVKSASGERFKARVEYEEPGAMLMISLCAKHGFSLNPQGAAGPTTIIAVDAVERILAGRGSTSRGVTNRPERLEWVLSVIAAAWSGQARALKSDMLLGLDTFNRLYPEADMHRVIGKLSRVLPSDLVILADYWRQARESPSTRIARAVYELYNKSMKASGRLPNRFNELT